jgi:hypothetical protein
MKRIYGQRMEQGMKIGYKPGLIFLISFLLFLIYPNGGHPFTLITPEEAAQPGGLLLRGMECSRLEGDGPQIKITSPRLDLPLRTPLAIDIVFEAASNKIIDYDSLRLRYLKLISIDLTSRVKPYLNNNRLMLKDVKVPQGRHCLQLLIGYTSGEKTLMEIVLNVEK